MTEPTKRFLPIYNYVNKQLPFFSFKSTQAVHCIQMIIDKYTLFLQ